MDCPTSQQRIKRCHDCGQQTQTEHVRQAEAIMFPKSPETTRICQLLQQIARTCIAFRSHVGVQTQHHQLATATESEDSDDAAQRGSSQQRSKAGDMGEAVLSANLFKQFASSAADSAPRALANLLACHRGVATGLSLRPNLCTPCLRKKANCWTTRLWISASLKLLILDALNGRAGSAIPRMARSSPRGVPASGRCSTARSPDRARARGLITTICAIHIIHSERQRRQGC